VSAGGLGDREHHTQICCGIRVAEGLLRLSEADNELRHGESRDSEQNAEELWGLIERMLMSCFKAERESKDRVQLEQLSYRRGHRVSLCSLAVLAVVSRRTRPSSRVVR
jgi:hypothetical protein